MSALRRYAWRFWLAGSEATVDVLTATYEEALAAARDQALGLAARLQEWATSDEGYLPQVAFGADVPNYWQSPEESQAWSSFRQVWKRNCGIKCECGEWNDLSANFCDDCGRSLRFWCTHCKKRLPKKGGIAH